MQLKSALQSDLRLCDELHANREGLTEAQLRYLGRPLVTLKQLGVVLPHHMKQVRHMWEATERDGLIGVATECLVQRKEGLAQAWVVRPSQLIAKAEILSDVHFVISEHDPVERKLGHFNFFWI